MSAIQIAGELCKVFEGYYPYPYLCPAIVATIGYGTTRYPNGRKVTLKDPPIDKGQALIYLYDELTKSMNRALTYCPILIENDNRLAAITDFVYNLGAGRLQNSTLRRKVNIGDWDAAKKELKKWVYASGRKLPGLVRRREAEAALL